MQENGSRLSQAINRDEGNRFKGCLNFFVIVDKKANCPTNETHNGQQTLQTLNIAASMKYAKKLVSFPEIQLFSKPSFILSSVFFCPFLGGAIKLFLVGFIYCSDVGN